MIVRCGACRRQFEAPGEGLFPCPFCGTQNEIRRRNGPASPEQPYGPPPEPTPDRPSPRATCGDCGFRFIVGDVETAPCPNCGATVTVGRGEG